MAGTAGWGGLPAPVLPNEGATRHTSCLCTLNMIFSGWLYLMLLEHLYPAALKGLGKPFDADLEKNMPHPSPIPLFKLPGLFKLPAPLTILAGERCSLLRPNSGFFLPSTTCVEATWNIHDTFSIWRERKQTTVGECRGKKFGCKLGSLQRAFQEHAFLWQGGDALTTLVNTNFQFFDN